MAQHTIRAVIFDFGNVICSFDIHKFINGIAAKSGKTHEDLLRVMPGINHLAVEYETGLVTSTEFFERLCTLAGVEIPREDFISAYTGIFTPIRETFDLIRFLKPSYKLGLLSNTNEWHFVHSIRTVDVYELFDAVTLSYEVKAMKPSPVIYSDMLRKLALNAEECAYIDDIEVNTDAARQMGLQAIQYLNPLQLRTALRGLGVLPVAV
jgi:glucose-1-phosphatase